MASTAAWSDTFSAPRPRSRHRCLLRYPHDFERQHTPKSRVLARMLACVLTRVLAGRLRRHGAISSGDNELSRRVALSASGALDANDLRPPIDNPIPAHRGKSLVDGVFTGCIGDQDDGHCLLGAPGLRGAA
jgi:hypothetical protein